MNEEEFIIKFYSCDDEEQFLKDVYHNLNCLRQENKQLKIQISAREEEYRKLEENWNKLKEYLHNQIPTDKTVLTKHIKIFELLDKMQEIEQGSDSNDSN